MLMSSAVLRDRVAARAEWAAGISWHALQRESSRLTWQVGQWEDWSYPGPYFWLCAWWIWDRGLRG